ncbi:MAG: hypothetical protein ABSA96_15165, partial [Candidatus Acidiferrales bacterium]
RCNRNRLHPATTIRPAFKLHFLARDRKTAAIPLTNVEKFQLNLIFDPNPTETTIYVVPIYLSSHFISLRLPP